MTGLAGLETDMEATLRAWKWPITLILITAAVLWLVVVGFGEQLGLHDDARTAVAGVAGFLGLTVFAPFIRYLFRDADGDGKPDVFQGGKGLVMLLAAFAIAGTLSACDPVTPQERAQAAISTGAETLKSFDELAADEYTRAAEQALEEASSFAEWQEAMVPWDRLEKSLRATKASLMTLQAALNVWVATGDKQTFVAMLPCFAAEADLLLEAARAAGFGSAVAKLQVVVELGAAYGEGLCRRGES